MNVGQGMQRKCACANDLIGIKNMCMRLKCCRELRDIVDMCLMIVMTMKKINNKKKEYIFYNT